MSLASLEVINEEIESNMEELLYHVVSTMSPEEVVKWGILAVSKAGRKTEEVGNELRVEETTPDVMVDKEEEIQETKVQQPEHHEETPSQTISQIPQQRDSLVSLMFGGKTSELDQNLLELQQETQALKEENLELHTWQDPSVVSLEGAEEGLSGDIEKAVKTTEPQPCILALPEIMTYEESEKPEVKLEIVTGS